MSGVENVQLTVAASSDEWHDTGIFVEHGDLIVVMAAGQVRVVSGMLQIAQTVDANGANGTRTGDGTLQMKVGSGGTTPIGQSGFRFVEEKGELKFKVVSPHPERNSGSFSVRVIHVPASLIPPTTSPKS